MARRREPVVVVGLGRFGGALASALTADGHEVLGIDSSEKAVAGWAGQLTQAVEADATDPTALAQLGVADYPHAVVGIGSHLEASVLATASLADAGVGTVWAKAVTEQHARILRLVGAERVVLPERDMGLRLAHLVSTRGRAKEYVDLDGDFALARCTAPEDLVGRTLEEAHVRRRDRVTVVCLTDGDGRFSYATPASLVRQDADLLVVGPPRAVEAFVNRAPVVQEEPASIARG